jgi:hypothetical protein
VKRSAPHKSRNAAGRSRGRAGEYPWAEWPVERLLKRRFRDLGLRIEGTEIEQNVQRLYRELDRRGIAYHPHCWLADEWFTPDGVGGIGIPFYLAHPRLRSLERNMMLEVEGGTPGWFMRILRHECGHALDNAYRLHRRRRYRELFGRWAAPYPQSYQPRPYSKSFVVHLDMWYAQAHPAEDFAETFAVWLRPGSAWRQRYQGWAALRKLEYVDELMAEIAGEKAPVQNRRHYNAAARLRTTLGEHYHAKRERYLENEWPDFYDRDLRRIYSSDPKFRHNPTAAKFLRGIKPDLRRMVARWTGEYQYTIEQVLDDIVDRCRELRLRLTRSPERARLDTIIMVTVQTMNYLHSGNHRVTM